jgi:hypothetical protein
MGLRAPHVLRGTTQLFSLAPPPVDVRPYRRREGDEWWGGVLGAVAWRRAEVMGGNSSSVVVRVFFFEWVVVRVRKRGAKRGDGPNRIESDDEQTCAEIRQNK